MSIAVSLPVLGRQLKSILRLLIFSAITFLLYTDVSLAQSWNIPSAGSTSSGYIGTTSGNAVLIQTDGVLMASFGLSSNIAMGSQTTASGWGSTAMGSLTVASGGQSTAMGSQTIASGFGSVAMGNLSIASGFASLAVGNQDTASGNQSVAMGNIARATQFGSFAAGNNTIASGQTAFAMGEGTVAPSYCETVVGSFNATYSPVNTVAFNAADRAFSIGIGTAGARSNALTVLKNGNIGIGTVSPAQILDVVGNIKFSGALMPNNTAGTAGQVLTSAGPGAPPTWAAASAAFSGTTNYVSKFTPTGTAIGSSEIYDNGTFVGIGTTTGAPGYLFAVNGKAIFTDVMVELYGNWPDFVFDDNYKLTPIAEVERYINEHKHLPGVASADEVEKKGIDIGVNQGVLLQKIEELTLYIIDQNKKIEVQNKESEEQNKKIDDQNKKIEVLQAQQSQIEELKKEVEDLKVLLQKSK